MFKTGRSDRNKTSNDHKERLSPAEVTNCMMTGVVNVTVH